MDISSFDGFIDVMTVGICLCLGYSFKKGFPGFPNRFIPLTLMICGGIIHILIYGKVDAACILTGMLSGLASTGVYEAGRNISQNQ